MCCLWQQLVTNVAMICTFIIFAEKTFFLKFSRWDLMWTTGSILVRMKNTNRSCSRSSDQIETIIQKNFLEDSLQYIIVQDQSFKDKYGLFFDNEHTIICCEKFNYGDILVKIVHNVNTDVATINRKTQLFWK